MYEQASSINTTALEKVKSWVMETLDHKPLSLDELFFDGLTLGEYLALSDEEEAALWNKWERTPLYDMNELENKRPNTGTLAAMLELKQGGGQIFNSTEELFADWEK